MKQKAYELLAPSITFGSVNSKKKSKSNTKFGIYPTKANQDYLFSLFVDYCKEEHEIDIDEDGNRITKLGVEFIEDVELLKEIINYKKGGNHDRMIAFEHALAWARYLDKEEIRPDFTNSKNRRMKEATNGKPRPKASFYSTRRAKPF